MKKINKFIQCGLTELGWNLACNFGLYIKGWFSEDNGELYTTVLLLKIISCKVKCELQTSYLKDSNTKIVTTALEKNIQWVNIW